MKRVIDKGSKSYTNIIILIITLSVMFLELALVRYTSP